MAAVAAGRSAPRHEFLAPERADAVAAAAAPDMDGGFVEEDQGGWRVRASAPACRGGRTRGGPGGAIPGFAPVQPRGGGLRAGGALPLGEASPFTAAGGTGS